MRHKVAVVGKRSLIVIIFLPITLFGLMLSVNEYRDQGMAAHRATVPLTVMALMAPSLVVYIGGAAYYGF